MTNLEDSDININPNYSGSIDIEKDLYVFIDESGDEGFHFEKQGTTKWFNVSGIIATPSVTTQMVRYVQNYRENKFPTKNMNRMSSKDLNHSQKKDIFSGLSEFGFTTTHSLLYKPDIDRKDKLATYPSMYFVGVKNIIERVSWYTDQVGKRRAHIIISNRNNIAKENMKEYLFKNSINADKNLYYAGKIGLVKLATANRKPQLHLADYSAYTLRVFFEKMGTPPRSEPYYFEMFQKGKLYVSNHAKWFGIWGNGLKLTPSTKSLIEQSGILNEGSHKS